MRRSILAAGIVLVVGAAGIYIALLSEHGLGASAALYIGLPLMLAYVFLLDERARTATGSILKWMSIALLLAAPILQEGYLCILLAAPVFFIVGGVVGMTIDYVRKRRRSRLETLPVTFIIALLSLEGTVPELSFERDYTVTAEKIVAAPVDAVVAQLSSPMQERPGRPLFLRLFPYPESNSNEGSAPGDRWTMHFVYYKHIFSGMKAGDLVFEVIERGDDLITFRAVHDDSYLNTYLQWQTSTVRWQSVDENRTRVSWELGYRRRLDPAWYFGPLQRYAATLAAQTLIDAAATPAETRAP